MMMTNTVIMTMVMIPQVSYKVTVMLYYVDKRNKDKDALVDLCHHDLSFPFIMSWYFKYFEVNKKLNISRWTKLRFAMIPLTVFLEPFSECMLSGALAALASYLLFRFKLKYKKNMKEKWKKYERISKEIWKKYERNMKEHALRGSRCSRPVPSF